MLTLRANAKINWSLTVRAVRPDGYHELDMLMQSISLCDTLCFRQSASLSLSVNGSPAFWDDKNLICRAANLLASVAGHAAGASITLEKRIPAMAGLGGGSADCAAALIALNRLWALNLPHERLLELGLALGADVPFCLTGGLARVRGIGERIQPLSAPPSPRIILVMPDGGLGTAAVFRRFDESPAQLPDDAPAAQAALTAGDYGRLDAVAFNDLMPAAVSLSPAVQAALDDMRALGSRFARMSGSGSCVFGVFDQPEAAFSALKKRYRAVFCVGTESEGVAFLPNDGSARV